MCVYIRVSYVYAVYAVRLFIAACSSKKSGSGVASKSCTVENGHFSNGGFSLELVCQYIFLQTYLSTRLIPQLVLQELNVKVLHVCLFIAACLSKKSGSGVEFHCRKWY